MVIDEQEMWGEGPTRQRCTRCGTDEQRGSYCTWCRMEEYDLIIHEHAAHNVCPLGTYTNPGPALADAHPERARQAIEWHEVRTPWE